MYAVFKLTHRTHSLSSVLQFLLGLYVSEPPATLMFHLYASHMRKSYSFKRREIKKYPKILVLVQLSCHEIFKLTVRAYPKWFVTKKSIGWPRGKAHYC